jgi:hypothetical protein
VYNNVGKVCGSRSSVVEIVFGFVKLSVVTFGNAFGCVLYGGLSSSSAS